MNGEHPSRRTGPIAIMMTILLAVPIMQITLQDDHQIRAFCQEGGSKFAAPAADKPVDLTAAIQ